jgi:L-threonylcarbamoyladenylate synthase
VTVIVPAGDPDVVEAAAAALEAGDIIGLPTETVYGLAADPFRAGATDRLFLVKGRPRSVELPVFVSGPEQAESLVVALTDAARLLMATYWPGPLTLVLPRRPGLDADLGSDDATIGLRCPDHPVPLGLCRRFGPYATTSANRHGDPPARTAAAAALAGVGLVIDGGRCDGSPSTVLDVTGAVTKVLREGAVARDEIARLVGDVE